MMRDEVLGVAAIFGAILAVVVGVLVLSLLAARLML